MKKSAPKTTRKITRPKEMQNEKDQMVKNGLQDVLGFSDSLLGFRTGSIGTELNQVDTLFKNNRWYLVSNMRQLLSQIYIEHGLIQTVVDVPVDDGLRGGVIIKSEQLSEDEIEEIRVEMEQNDDVGTIGQAMKWNRLFGGAGVMIITDQDPAEPFEISSLKEDSKLEFRAVDMWELFWSKQNTSDYSAVIDGPDLQDVKFYDYYGHKVHHSRVMKLKGMTAPSFVRPRLRGWGFSIVEALINSINQYLKANNLIFEVLDEFKIDVYKIKNLANTLVSPNGAEKVHRRIQLANHEKNFQNAITMDSEDDYIQKELSFAGVAETMVGIRMQIASDLRMPLTKVFGISAAGFNSGEDDIENYNSMVESSIRQKSKFDIIKMIKLRCQVKFGFVPDDITIEFKPLRVLTSEQEENVKTQQFARLLQAEQAGVISIKEFKQGVNKNNLLPIQIDENLEKLETASDENSEEPKPNAPKSTIAPKAAKNSIEREVAIVGIICGDEILTGQRKDSGLWVFPGGSRENGESLDMTAIRETMEEAGIKLDPKKLKEYPTKKVGEFSICAYLYEMDKKQMPRTILDPDTEVHNWRWVPLSVHSLELQPENRHHENDLIMDLITRRLKK